MKFAGRLSGLIFITQQPQNVELDAFGIATFYAEAIGYKTVQWQYLEPDLGQNPQWTNVPGATELSLSVNVEDLSKNGYAYRCVFTSRTVTLESDQALLTITLAGAPPVITQQPSNASVVENTTAAFSVTATGATPFSYQWQRNTGGGYADMVGEELSSLSFTATLADDGYMYRCVVTNAFGSVTSESALLSVSAAIAIPDTPTGLADTFSNETQVGLAWNDIATNETSYVVQRKLTSSSTWVTVATIAANSTSHTDSGLSPGVSYDFRVGARNSAGTAYSTPITVVTSASANSPEVIIDPKSQTINDGNYAVLQIRAQGPGLSYQWEEDDGLGWSDMAGETSEILVTPGLAVADDGIKYRCRVTNVNGTSYSNAATISVAVYAPVYALDDVAGVVQAASLYKLKAAQATCCTIKRSSDGTTTTIGFVGQLPDIKTAMTFCGSGDGIITQFSAFTAENPLVAPSDAHAPFLIKNGKPCIGTNGLPVAAFLSNNDPYLGDLHQHAMRAALITPISIDDVQVFAGYMSGVPHDNVDDIPVWELDTSDSYCRYLSKREQSVGGGQLTGSARASASINDMDTFEQAFALRSVCFLSTGENVVKLNYRESERRTGVAAGSTNVTGISIGLYDDGDAHGFNGDFVFMAVYAGLSEAQAESVYEKVAAAIPKIGPTTNVSKRLLASTWWGDKLWNWLNARVPADFDVPTNAVATWDGTYSTDEELHRLWGLAGVGAPAFINGDDIWSNSGEYCIDDGGQDPVQLTETGRCWIEAANPDATHGGENQLYVARPESGNHRVAYIEYDLTGQTADITEGVMRFIARDGGGTGRTYICCKLYFDVPFDPNTATWNNPPTSVAEEAWDEIEGITEAEYDVESKFYVRYVTKTPFTVEGLHLALNAGIQAGATKVLVKLYDGSFVFNQSTPSRVFYLDYDLHTTTLSVQRRRGYEAYEDLCNPSQDFDNDHHSRNGNTAGILVGLNLPLAGGGQGNPFYQHSGMAHRGMSLDCLYLLSHERCVTRNDGNADAMHFIAKRTRSAAHNYYYLKNFYPADVREAFEMGALETLRYLAWIPNTDVNTNMDTEASETAAAFAAACRDNYQIRDEALLVLANCPFGSPYGTDQNTHPERKVFWPDGYIGEYDGPDASYNGRSLYHYNVALAFMHWDDAAVALYTPFLQRMWEWDRYQFIPNGNGGYESPRAHNCRTAEGAENSQMSSDSARGLSGALYADDAIQEAKTGFPTSAAEFIAGIQSGISKLNTGKAEGSHIVAGSGYNQPLYDGHPWSYRPFDAFWSEEVPPIFPADFVSQLNAKFGTNYDYVPADRPGESYNIQHSADLPEFWTVRDYDGGAREFGFYVSAVNHSINYNGWYGGIMDTFWVRDMGVVFNSTHGKTGSDGGREDTRTYSTTHRWPVHHIFGEWKALIVGMTGSGTGAVLEIDGDQTAFFRTGVGYRIIPAEYAGVNVTMTNFSAVSYNAVSGKTELTVGTNSAGASPTNIAIGQYISHIYTTAVCNQNDRDPFASPTPPASELARTHSEFLLSDPDPRVESTTYLGPYPYIGVPCKASGILSSGLVTLKKVFRKLADGASIDHIITADATAQTQYRSDCKVGFGTMLTNPWDVGTEFQSWNASLGGWEFMSTGTTESQYIRIRRVISGIERYVYVWLDGVHKVSLGEVYTTPYQLTKQMRCLRIHLHDQAGVPELWPASDNLLVSIRTTAPPVGSTELTSAAILKPADNTRIPTGAIFAARWSTTWGPDGAGTQTIQYYDGTWHDIATDIYDNGDGTFDGVTQTAFPDTATAWRIRLVDGGALEVFSPSRALSVITPTVSVDDTFTDIDNTLVENHTPDSGAWDEPKTTIGEVEIVSNRAQQLVTDTGSSWLLSLCAVQGQQQVSIDTQIDSFVNEKTQRGPFAIVCSRTGSSTNGVSLGVVKGGNFKFNIGVIGSNPPSELYPATQFDLGTDVYPYYGKVIRLEAWCLDAETVSARVYNVTDAVEICRLAIIEHGETNSNRKAAGIYWSNSTNGVNGVLSATVKEWT